MSLRIIGGEFRNRALKAPKGPQTRPSLAVLRKAVFDILQEKVVGAEMLDLFAGTGAMGLEAISRGASSATFVDSDRYALKCIQENIDTFKIGPQCKVMGSDVFVALKTLSKKQARFDLIYIDPPYALAIKKGWILEILTQIELGDLLKEEGRLFIEEGAPSHLETELLVLKSLRWINTRKFSQSILHQFIKEGRQL